MAALWAMVVGVVWLAVWIDNPLAYLAAFVVMGPLYVRFAILMHEAAHKLLFTNKALNDWVGTWLIAYPAFTPITLYRRGHFAHHREEFGPDEPDLAFYGGYRCTRATLWRRLVRDAVGISGWKNFKVLCRSVRSTSFRRIGLSILGVQALLWALAWVATGRWWIYPLLWWLPWMTQWRVLNRLRSIGEHGGMRPHRTAGSPPTTSASRSAPASGWCPTTPVGTWPTTSTWASRGATCRPSTTSSSGPATSPRSITYPSYRALWRALSSATEPAVGAGGIGAA